MREFHIFPIDSWVIRQLYTEVLCDDPEWHFFYEGEVNYIRCSEKFAEDVIEWCKEMNIVCIDKGPWEENIDITKKYLPQFKTIFHEYAVLAMTVTTEDFDGVLDRVIHCFLNMNRNEDDIAKLGEYMGPRNAYLMWEPYKISMCSLMRSYTIGRLIEASRKSLDNNNKKE